MKTAFIVYRPVMDYEESMEPRLVFTTRKAAERARNRIVKWAHKVVQSLPGWPEDADTLQAQCECPQYEQREEIIKTAKSNTPYGWRFCFSDLDTMTDRFSEGCIDIMELPLNPKP